MTQNVDVFWSYRSPYSYMALTGLKAIRDDFRVLINIRPVYPLAMRDKAFFRDMRKQQLPYMVVDMQREAQRQNISFQWPRPDPIVQDMVTRKVAPRQPMMDRLMPLGIMAQQAGPEKSFEFFVQTSALIFDGQTENWHEGPHLADAAARAGFDLAEMELQIADQKSSLAAEIIANQDAHENYHWGVPTMVWQGEAFFGQDRLAALRWRLEQAAATAH